MKFAEVVFLQGDEALEPLAILDEKGEQAAIEYLKQWDYGDNPVIESKQWPWGMSDRNYKEGNYILSYNMGIGYISLIEIIEF